MSDGKKSAPNQKENASKRNADQTGRPTRRYIVGAAAAGATAALTGGGAPAQAKGRKRRGVDVRPIYFPRRRHFADVDLVGKLAVVTGASRGIGRATAEALIAKGARVIGTSRDPAGVPNPPAFPLLPLDVADPASVAAFGPTLASTPAFQQRGQIDILINNGARFVLGQIIPQPPTDFVTDYLANRDLGVRTVYTGQVMLTTALLPLMAQADYSRIVFTVSVTSYQNGSTVFGNSGADVYFSAKTALRIYANHLDTTLRGAGSPIKVSTVNPYFVNTGLADGLNPIFTQPVNAQGLSDSDPVFSEALIGIRALLANALPASLVADAFVQLLEMADPLQNVVAASRRRRLAIAGGNEGIEDQYIAENAVSAMPLRAASD